MEYVKPLREVELTEIELNDANIDWENPFDPVLELRYTTIHIGLVPLPKFWPILGEEWFP
jgi:hypothetical protein